MAIVNGTNGDDTLYGTSDSDQISEFVGNDTLKGFGGADHLDGGNGWDTAFYDDSPVGVSVNLRRDTGSAAPRRATRSPISRPSTVRHSTIR
jgi:Ca2+-binding RTX toxin-like protein